MNKMRSKILVEVITLLAVAILGAQQQPRVTGFFTNMRPDPAGDVDGTEVWLVYARGHFYATVQDAAGEPNPPVVVPVDVSGSRIKFSINRPTNDPTPTESIPKAITHYSGIVSKAGLMLGIEGNQAVLLKRQTSYWQ